jgi:hypothetical protein
VTLDREEVSPIFHLDVGETVFEHDKWLKAESPNLDWNTLVSKIISFRSGCERARSALPSFPLGCCGTVCDLLEEHLRREGFGTFESICGDRHNPYQSHAWLTQDGLIVDITADQFAGENQPSVIVTYHSSWHATWTQRPPRPTPPFMTDQQFREFYNAILTGS